jgi:uncharacterized protein (TIGR03437 family)
MVTLYATGAGVTNPPISDGTVPQNASATPVLPVAATIDGQTATVTSAYAAPGMIGVFVANVQVPAAARPGNAIPITLEVGHIAEPSGRHYGD